MQETTALEMCGVPGVVFCLLCLVWAMYLIQFQNQAKVRKTQHAAELEG
jgi:hypothetical protein